MTVGARGPVGKRGPVKAGHRTKEELDVEKLDVIGPVDRPDELGFDAHPLVEDFFESLKNSGQSQFYEPSDWQAARFVCFQMNEHIAYMLTTGKVNSNSFAAIWSSMNDLLATEGSRRRVKLEIDRSQGEAEVVDFMSAYKEMLKGSE